MDYQYNKDLFEHTKMTFGEHLEELRGTLLKSSVALSVFFVIGLFYAGSVVSYIQTPLRKSLVSYYKTLGTDELAQKLAQRAGRETPNEVDQKEAVRLVDEEGFLAEERYINPLALANALNINSSELTRETDPDNPPKPRPRAESTPGREDLVKVLLYYPAAEDSRIRVIGLGVHEAFMVWIKAGLLVGVLFSCPALFYFIWEFVGAGLYPHEKRYVHIFLPFSIILFLAGALLAFFAVIQFVLDFLFPFYASMGIEPDPRIGEWLNFVLILPVGFGVSFQLPLVMLFLERIGIFTAENYLSKWKIAVIVIAILSMLLTPGDPYSMILMLVPMTLLYFGGVALCRYLPKRKTPFGDEVGSG